MRRTCPRLGNTDITAGFTLGQPNIHRTWIRVERRKGKQAWVGSGPGRRRSRTGRNTVRLEPGQIVGIQDFPAGPSPFLPFVTSLFVCFVAYNTIFVAACMSIYTHFDTLYESAGMAAAVVDRTTISSRSQARNISQPGPWQANQDRGRRAKNSFTGNLLPRRPCPELHESRLLAAASDLTEALEIL